MFTLEEILSYTIPSGDCLEWTRCFNTDGYPRAGRKGNHNLKVHRVVFELTNGYLPEVVRHSCDNTKCLNPDHLLPGTPTLNMVDRGERGRTSNHVSKSDIEAVKRLRAEGMTYKNISIQLKIAPKRVEYIVTRKAGG